MINKQSEEESKYLNLIIEQKDILITELSDKISILKKQVDLLEKFDSYRKNSIQSNGARINKSPLPSGQVTSANTISSQGTMWKKPVSFKNKRGTNESEDICSLSVNKISNQKNEGSISQEESTDGTKIVPLRKPTKDKQNLPKFIKGTRQTQTDPDAFSGTEQRIWVHVGRVQLHTTEEAIKKHLELVFPGRNFIIERLSARQDAKSLSFKIGGDFDLKEKLYMSENWPNGVTIRRFTFFRGSSASTR